MRYRFPDPTKGYTYLQTNRSDDLGSIWSSFNLDFQTNLGVIRASTKLVTTTVSTTMGIAGAFEYYNDAWYAVVGTGIRLRSSELLTGTFSAQSAGYSLGDSTTQFDITNPAGTTFRYTYDGTGTNPGINASTVPTGAAISISGTNFAAGNNTGGIVTGSGTSYFEITNASGVVESNKTIGSGVIQVVGGSLATDYDANKSDLAVFNDRLWATADDKLNSFEGAYWVERDELDSSAAHKLCYFKKFDQLYYIDTNKIVSSIDTDDQVYNTGTGDYSINIGDSVGIATTIVASSSVIWIGTMRTNTSGSDGLMGSILAWDGISAQVTQDYPITAAGVLAMVVYNDIPYALDSEGRVLQYTGTAFEEIARLPVVRTLLANANGDATVNRFCHMNGMVATKDNTLQLLINNLNDEDDVSVNENLPSGIWELDLATQNFTHRYSPTLKAYNSSTITDFGQSKILGVGALKLNTLSATSSAGRATLVCGLGYYTDATTASYGIYIDSPAAPDSDVEGQKRAYFVTTWFESEEIQDKFTRLWSTFRKFLSSDDKLEFKYRIDEEDPILATITWTSTTTFTTTTNVSAYGPGATGFNGTSGGEVEVLQGTGAGSCTHISSITENAGTYTVTLDTAVTGVTGTAIARLQKWIKLFPASEPGQVKSYQQMPVGASNTRIQIKGCMQFITADEFHKLILISNEDIKATA